jgi:hypothetical protein
VKIVGRETRTVTHLNTTYRKQTAPTVGPKTTKLTNCVVSVKTNTTTSHVRPEGVKLGSDRLLDDATQTPQRR